MDNYIGEIRAFAFGNTPTGWMACEGQTMQVRQYNALSALIGNRYGGDGQTTFKLPDLRGRAMLGYGISETTTQYPLAKSDGKESVILTSGNVPAHTHTFSVANALGTAPTTAGSYLSKEATFGAITGEIINTFNTPTNPPTNIVPLNGVNVSGLSATHENRVPSLTLQLCIAVTGLWPSRS